MEKPFTTKEPLTEQIFDIAIADDYRWLENPDSNEVKNWISTQNLYLEKSLNGKHYQEFSDALSKNFKRTTFSCPVKVGSRYFYTERKPNEDQTCFYFKDGIDGQPVKLVDPNEMNTERTTALDLAVSSWTGKYLVYGLSTSGTEMTTLYIRDIDKNNDLNYSIPNCRYSIVSWLNDDSGFFYTRNPRKGEVPDNELTMHTKIYLHILNTDPKTDLLVFGENRPKDDMFGMSNVSEDGKYLAITVASNWVENDVYIYNIHDKKLIPIIQNKKALFRVQFIQNRLYALTNYEANNNKLIMSEEATMFKDVESWTTVIPEREYLLKNFDETKSKIIVEYLHNACSKLVMFDLYGKQIEQLPIPQFSSKTRIASRRNEEEFFFGAVSFTFPHKIFRFDPVKNEYTKYREVENNIDETEFTIKQEWFSSKDGTKIPMFIIHKKSIILNSNNPTILYGYGGFGSSDTPHYLSNLIPWFSNGGVYAIANIRGNGEFGEKWHKAAIKENKQNSFDDFICAAEHLISEKYTNTNRLGILGGSNGGLLTLSVSIQRPDLFKAVCARVPLADMVRFPLFGMASRWVNEYGNPDIKNELESILKWSPYHNVNANVEYPSTLITTGIKDSRVDPLHARKMGALLQNQNKINQVFIYTEMDAGHGAGKPVKKIVESFAYVLTFFSDKLKLYEQ